LKMVRRVDRWANSSYFAQWEHPSEADKNWPKEWFNLLEHLVSPGCNIVDIGAHGGDTTIPLAVASRGGEVVAIEMGPPIDMLKINARLNPQLKIHVHKVAVSDVEGSVRYMSGCGGCNGGIDTVLEGKGKAGERVPAVRLLPFLQDQHPELLSNLCMVKIDTEGHDAAILASLASDPWRPPVVWVEWFAGYKKGPWSSCSEGSQRLFTVAADLGYSLYRPSLPLTPIKGCQNRYYEKDLLLVHKNHHLDQT